MQPPKSSQIVLKYNIVPKENGVLLCIWEPAPVTDERIKPFLYMVRQRLATEDEAQKVLNYYLSVYE